LVPTLAAVALLVSGCTAVGAAAAPAGGGQDAWSTGRGLVAADATPDASVSASAAAKERRQIRGTDTIQLDAEQLALTGPDDLLRTRSMRDADGTVATLTALLGRPKVTQTAVGDGAHCVPASTSYTWGGAIRVIDLAKTAAVGNGYDVRILAPTVRSRTGTEIHLQGPDGVTVGDDLADRIAATPDTDKESYESDGTANWQVVLEHGWNRTTADDGPHHDGVNGVSAITTGTTVAVIGSPMPVHTRDDC
jgi:hypothetical protein